MKCSESINEISKAMSLAQQDMKPAQKDSVNPFFKNKYSTLNSVWESIRSPLTSNGLAVFQDVSSEEKSVSVTTRIVHGSGQWIEFGPLCMPLFKFDPQTMGSTITYAKRYALCAAVGVVADEDDDGEKGMARDKITKKELTELENIFAECDPEYIQSVITGLKKMGIDSYANITQALYPRVLSSAQKNKEEFSKKSLPKNDVKSMDENDTANK